MSGSKLRSRSTFNSIRRMMETDYDEYYATSSSDVENIENFIQLLRLDNNVYFRFLLTSATTTCARSGIFPPHLGKKKIHRSIKIPHAKPLIRRFNAWSLSNFRHSIADYAYGYIDVGYRNERSCAGGRELLHDIKVITYDEMSLTGNGISRFSARAVIWNISWDMRLKFYRARQSAVGIYEI